MKTLIVTMHHILMRSQLKQRNKSEQQAFAGKGLDYVTDKYLPERLTEMVVI